MPTTSITIQLQMSYTARPGGVVLADLTPPLTIDEGVKLAGKLVFLKIETTALFQFSPTGAIMMELYLPKINLGGLVALQAGPRGKAAKTGPYGKFSYDAADPIATSLNFSCYTNVLGVKRYHVV